MTKAQGHVTLDARTALLQAAARLFAQQGYQATGVQQITNAAGINKAMLYYYFGHKEGLYNELIDAAVGAVECAVATAEQTEDSIASRLMRFLRGYLSVVTEQPDLARMLFREVMGSGEQSSQRALEHFSDILRRLDLIFAGAEEMHELRALDPSLLAYSLFGMATMYISSHFLTGRPLDPPALAEYLVDLFLHGAAVS
jgi:AcrR family transcriptional regulator